MPDLPELDPLPLEERVLLLKKLAISTPGLATMLGRTCHEDCDVDLYVLLMREVGESLIRHAHQGMNRTPEDTARLGGMLAELLGFNSVSAVSGLNIEGGKLIINREIDGGSQVLTVAAPVVLIVQKGIAKEPRIPAMRGIMMARKKPLNVIPAIDAADKTAFVSYEMPPPKAACKMVDEENAKELIAMLHEEAKVL